MEGYHKPEISREDMAEAENVFLSITSDGEIYRLKMPIYARYVRMGRKPLARYYLGRMVGNVADYLEMSEACNGPIGHMARAIAAVWLEDYYRDHMAEGGLKS